MFRKPLTHSNIFTNYSLFQQIIVGDSRVVLAGGTESMSQAPFVVRNTRFGTTLGANYEVIYSIHQLFLISKFFSLKMFYGKVSPINISKLQWYFELAFEIH